MLCWCLCPPPPSPTTSLGKVYADNLHGKTDHSNRTKFLKQIFKTRLVSSTPYSPTRFV